LENGKADVTLSRLEELANLFKVGVSELVSPTRSMRLVTVKQKVAAGIWSESPMWPEDDWYDVPVPDDPELRNVNLYGAENSGPSMNRRYPDGSALIFTSMIETREGLMPGKRYIVEVEKPDGLREATVKQLWKDDGGKFWLLPESTDPRYQQPIDLEGSDGDMIRIVGRIRYAVQREA
jgi:phage repressor protein C with HTH and peptisase S24 domain